MVWANTTRAASVDVKEFGSIEYIAAAPTHLAKIERVQRTAERMCGCKFDPLSGRREATVFAYYDHNTERSLHSYYTYSIQEN